MRILVATMSLSLSIASIPSARAQGIMECAETLSNVRGMAKLALGSSAKYFESREAIDAAGVGELPAEHVRREAAKQDARMYLEHFAGDFRLTKTWIATARNEGCDAPYLDATESKMARIYLQVNDEERYPTSVLDSDDPIFGNKK